MFIMFGIAAVIMAFASGFLFGVLVMRQPEQEKTNGQMPEWWQDNPPVPEKFVKD